jgi:hypothetical protein
MIEQIGIQVGEQQHSLSDIDGSGKDLETRFVLQQRERRSLSYDHHAERASSHLPERPSSVLHPHIARLVVSDELEVLSVGQASLFDSHGLVYVLCLASSPGQLDADLEPLERF